MYDFEIDALYYMHPANGSLDFRKGVFRGVVAMMMAQNKDLVSVFKLVIETVRAGHVFDLEMDHLFSLIPQEWWAPWNTAMVSARNTYPENSEMLVI